MSILTIFGNYLSFIKVPETSKVEHDVSNYYFSIIFKPATKLIKFAEKKFFNGTLERNGSVGTSILENLVFGGLDENYKF